MAALKELVATIATIEGIPEATVTEYAQHLQAAGLLPQSGRGSSAASMTAKDAANLLMAVNAAPSADRAPTVIGWYNSLINYGRRQDYRPSRASEKRYLKKFGFLAKTELLTDTITHLLQVAADGHLRRYLHNIALVELLDPMGEFGVDVGSKLRNRLRATLAGGDSSELARLRRELHDELDEELRTSRVALFIRFYRPYPGAQIQLRRGGVGWQGRPEDGHCLLDAEFQLNFDEDEICALEDYFHNLRFIAKSEAITIDQRALLTVGELLGQTAAGQVVPMRRAPD
jgi:hypothetical protein